MTLFALFVAIIVLLFGVTLVGGILLGFAVSAQVSESPALRYRVAKGTLAQTSLNALEDVHWEPKC